MQCHVKQNAMQCDGAALWAAQGSEPARRATHPGSLRPCWFNPKEHPVRLGTAAGCGKTGFRSMAHQEAEAGSRRFTTTTQRGDPSSSRWWWRGGAVAHHARLAARLERRVLPIHLAILGALAAKLLEVVASEMTAAVRRRGAEREKNKRIRCRASHPWLRSDSPPSSLLPDDLTMIS